MSHTPGPWSMGDTRDVSRKYGGGSAAEVAVHVGAHGQPPGRGNAFAIVSLGGPGATSARAADVEANAQLIAAAPDLLEACKAALPWVREYLCQAHADVKSLGGTFADRVAFDKLESAIAKAEGKA